MDIDAMKAFHWCIFSLGLAATPLLPLSGGEILLFEPFDTLEAAPLTGQSDWFDNSKMGEAAVVGTDSLSMPNHLQLSQGGAVHREIAKAKEGASAWVFAFAARRGASEAGQNLQFSLRSASGESVLFLNLRGSGRSLDLGPNSETLSELNFGEPLPSGVWFRVETSWKPEGGALQVKVTSVDGGTVYLDQAVELPFEAPTRIIVGSTSRVKAGEWALDDLHLKTAP